MRRTSACQCANCCGLKSAPLCNKSSSQTVLFTDVTQQNAKASAEINCTAQHLRSLEEKLLCCNSDVPLSCDHRVDSVPQFATPRRLYVCNSDELHLHQLIKMRVFQNDPTTMLKLAFQNDKSNEIRQLPQQGNAMLYKQCQANTCPLWKHLCATTTNFTQTPKRSWDTMACVVSDSEDGLAALAFPKETSRNGKSNKDSPQKKRCYEICTSPSFSREFCDSTCLTNGISEIMHLSLRP